MSYLRELDALRARVPGGIIWTALYAMPEIDAVSLAWFMAVREFMSSTDGRYPPLPEDR